MTVGDFVLFISYLAVIPNSPTASAATWRSIGRPGLPMRAWAPCWMALRRTALVERTSLHLRGVLPPLSPPVRHATDRLDLLEARGLTYRYPRHRPLAMNPATGRGHGIDGVDLRLPRGSVTVVTGRVGAGKTTLLRTLWACCRRSGRDPVERRACGRPSHLPRAAARGLHPAGAAPLQRDAARQHPARPARRSCGPGRRRAGRDSGA